MKEKNALIMAQFEDAKGWMESAVRLIDIEEKHVNTTNRRVYKTLCEPILF